MVLFEVALCCSCFLVKLLVIPVPVLSFEGLFGTPSVRSITIVIFMRKFVQKNLSF
jgi:hypothetical protein